MATVAALALGVQILGYASAMRELVDFEVASQIHLQQRRADIRWRDVPRLRADARKHLRDAFAGKAILGMLLSSSGIASLMVISVSKFVSKFLG